MSLLAVDLLGAGAGSPFEEVVGRSDLETAIGHIADYLIERGDVDADRIAIVADGWGSSFVARGIAFDDRFAAAVCDGGIWDIHEQAFLRDRIGVAGRRLHSAPDRQPGCPKHQMPGAGLRGRARMAQGRGPEGAS